MIVSIRSRNLIAQILLNTYKKIQVLDPTHSKQTKDLVDNSNFQKMQGKTSMMKKLKNKDFQ